MSPRGGHTDNNNMGGGPKTADCGSNGDLDLHNSTTTTDSRSIPSDFHHNHHPHHPHHHNQDRTTSLLSQDSRMDCIRGGPGGDLCGPPDRFDHCGGGGPLNLNHDRLDGTPMGPDRLDYHNHHNHHNHHNLHERLIDCGGGPPGNPSPLDRLEYRPLLPQHDRLEFMSGPLGLGRMECEPDANMNTLGKLGPVVSLGGGIGGGGLGIIRPMNNNNNLICDGPGGKEQEFGPQSYGMLQDRGCLDLRRPMAPLTPAEPEIPGTCAGCGGRILDRYYLHAVEKQWHTHCLTCSDCHFRLDSEITCFARDGNIYCKTDYYRRFAIKNCSRCQLPIQANELIMRAKDHVFHLSCFACSACNRTLKSGEQYGIRDNLLYCRMDYELMFHGEFGMPPSMSPGGQGASSPGGGPMPFYNGVGGAAKGRPRKRKSPMSDSDGCGGPLNLGLDASDRHGDVLDRDGYPHQTPRPKRVRTSFKHHQLRTMKSYFALNHNPDAKDLKQLAQKTGLSKRVLQVWFQNARAKYRRNILKQESSDGKSGGQGQDSNSPSHDGMKDDKDGSSIMDMNSGSPALSDISSTPSLNDIHHSSNLDADHNSSSNTSISDLFSSTIATIN